MGWWFQNVILLLVLTRCSPVGFKENIFFVCFSLNPPDFQRCSRVADVQLSGNQNNLRSLGMMDVLPCWSEKGSCHPRVPLCREGAVAVCRSTACKNGAGSAGIYLLVVKREKTRQQNRAFLCSFCLIRGKTKLPSLEGPGCFWKWRLQINLPSIWYPAPGLPLHH